MLTRGVVRACTNEISSVHGGGVRACTKCQPCTLKFSLVHARIFLRSEQVCIYRPGYDLDLAKKNFSKETEKKQSYTKYKKYHGTPSNSWNDLTDMQGPDDDEDKSYLYEDMIPDNDDTDR